MNVLHFYVISVIVITFTIKMVSGAGEVITGATTSQSTITCAAGAGNTCKGKLRLCANTATPASSGTCVTFAADAEIANAAALSFAYTNANLAALELDIPGTYLVSSRQDVTVDSTTTSGTEITETISVPSTGVITIPFTLVNHAVANPFVVPVITSTTCSCGTSGKLCQRMATTEQPSTTTNNISNINPGGEDRGTIKLCDYLSLGHIILIAIGGVMLIYLNIVIILLCCIWKRRNKSSNQLHRSNNHTYRNQSEIDGSTRAVNSGYQELEFTNSPDHQKHP